MQGTQHQTSGQQGDSTVAQRPAVSTEKGKEVEVIKGREHNHAG
jgi:hypothetical protein